MTATYRHNARTGIRATCDKCPDTTVRASIAYTNWTTSRDPREILKRGGWDKIGWRVILERKKTRVVCPKCAPPDPEKPAAQFTGSEVSESNADAGELLLDLGFVLLALGALALVWMVV